MRGSNSRALPQGARPLLRAPVLLLPAAELATTEPEVREILLAQKAAWNWADFQSRYNFTGWDETTNICDWSGVECAYNLTTEPETRNTDPMEGFTL